MEATSTKRLVLKQSRLGLVAVLRQDAGGNCRHSNWPAPRCCDIKPLFLQAPDKGGGEGEEIWKELGLTSAVQ